MFTQAELIDAINQLEGGKHSIQNCERLAAIYTVLDHLYTEPKLDAGYSRDNKVETETIVGNYGDSEFLKAISGKPANEIWDLIDELIDAISVLNPRLVSSFFNKLYDI